MGNISTLLSAMMSAVYGRDVRQSIHDAIEQCYADATSHTDASEITYGETTVEEELESLKGSIVAGGVPSQVKQALLRLFESGAYASAEMASEYAVLEAWASKVTSLALDQTEISITGAKTVQLSAFPVPSGSAVSWSSSNELIATVSSSGLVTGVNNGTVIIAAVSGDLMATCRATVSGFATLTGITAAYTQSGPVYDTGTLEDLIADLVVTALYDDASTRTVASTNYTLSGVLEDGTSTITVTYGSMSTTFDVTVTSNKDTIYALYQGSSDWPTLTATEDGSPAAFADSDSFKAFDGGGYWTYFVGSDSKIAGGTITFNIDESQFDVTGGGAMALYAVSKDRTTAYGRYYWNADSWGQTYTGDCQTSVHAFKDIKIPDGYYPYLMVRRAGLTMHDDTLNTNVNFSNWLHETASVTVIGGA